MGRKLEKTRWKTAAKKPVKNVDLWKRLDAACQQHEVEWRWVAIAAINTMRLLTI